MSFLFCLAGRSQRPLITPCTFWPLLLHLNNDCRNFKSISLTIADCRLQPCLRWLVARTSHLHENTFCTGPLYRAVTSTVAPVYLTGKFRKLSKYLVFTLHEYNIFLYQIYETFNKVHINKIFSPCISQRDFKSISVQKKKTI